MCVVGELKQLYATKRDVQQELDFRVNWLSGRSDSATEKLKYRLHCLRARIAHLHDILEEEEPHDV